jgi:hypothetical protein
MPWNNCLGFRIYAKTVKYENIIALNILFNRNFRIKIIVFVVFESLWYFTPFDRNRRGIENQPHCRFLWW